MTLEQFMQRVEITPTCWIWKGGMGSQGYGMAYHNGYSIPTHRVSYMLHKGDIPKGMMVLHSCDNPPCVNPAHLRLGTAADNGKDRRERGTRKPKDEQRKVVTLTEEGERMLREILGTHIPQPKRTNMVHQLILDEYRRLVDAGVINAASILAQAKGE